MYKLRFFGPRENPDEMEQVINNLCEEEGFELDSTSSFKDGGILFILKKKKKSKEIPENNLKLSSQKSMKQKNNK